MPLLIVIATLAVVLAVKRSARIPSKTAAEYLHSGAMLIDVRSAGEFTAQHLPQAVNIPLSEIETVIARKVKDKNQVLLLHCQGGGRSNAAMKKLRAMGYPNAYNLGSYGRAAQIVRSRVD
jgi:phage shock protein E